MERLCRLGKSLAQLSPSLISLAECGQRKFNLEFQENALLSLNDLNSTAASSFLLCLSLKTRGAYIKHDNFTRKIFYTFFTWIFSDNQCNKAISVTFLFAPWSSWPSKWDACHAKCWKCCHSLHSPPSHSAHTCPSFFFRISPINNNAAQRFVLMLQKLKFHCGLEYHPLAAPCGRDPYTTEAVFQLLEQRRTTHQT
jgi:hypothetical protein